MVVEALGQRRWATELFVFTDAKSITPDLVNGAARINVGNAHLEVSAPVEVERQQISVSGMHMYLSSQK